MKELRSSLETINKTSSDFICDIDRHYDNGYFGIDDNASREVLVNALWCLEDSPEPKSVHSFTDVSDEKNYVNAISWAEENGIIQGSVNNIFGPEDALTREQMATILWRYAEYKGCDVSVGKDTDIHSYVDYFKISKYAVDAMRWACDAGLVEDKKIPILGMALSPKARSQEQSYSCCCCSLTSGWSRQNMPLSSKYLKIVWQKA